MQKKNQKKSFWWQTCHCNDVVRHAQWHSQTLITSKVSSFRNKKRQSFIYLQDHTDAISIVKIPVRPQGEVSLSLFIHTMKCPYQGMFLRTGECPYTLGNVLTHWRMLIHIRDCLYILVPLHSPECPCTAGYPNTLWSTITHWGMFLQARWCPDTLANVHTH